jgi:uncharacterized Zn-finger protein
MVEYEKEVTCWKCGKKFTAERGTIAYLYEENKYCPFCFARNRIVWRQ